MLSKGEGKETLDFDWLQVKIIAVIHPHLNKARAKYQLTNQLITLVDYTFFEEQNILLKQ